MYLIGQYGVSSEDVMLRYNFFAGQPCISLARAPCVGTSAVLTNWLYSNERAGCLFSTQGFCLSENA